MFIMYMRRFSWSAVLALVVAGGASAAPAAIISYDAVLSGPASSPPTPSPGTGLATVDIDTSANTMHVHVDFSGLLSTTTASHIHSATTVPLTGNAGVATTSPNFTGFPLGVTSGSYDSVLDLTLASTYNSSFITANGGTTASAAAALEAGIAAGEAYWNIHTTTFPGGEIRGFLVPAPEPASLGVLASSGLLLLLRRRRSAT